MQHPFDALSQEYAHRWSVMKLTRPTAAFAAASSLLNNRQTYDLCEKLCGVPSAWVMCANERESDGDLRTFLGNGQPLNQVTTEVPAGFGPFATWQAGAAAALKYDGVTAVSSWTIPRAFYQWEAWNGFGPRAHGIPTGYLWAGTDQYIIGKYISDGVWSPVTIDKQLGTAAVFWALLQLAPNLGAAFGTIPVPVKPAVIPVSLPMGLQDTEALQKALNALGYGPLVVDNSYGRKTTRAVRAFQTDKALSGLDGIAGPETWAAITAALAAKTGESV